MSNQFFVLGVPAGSGIGASLYAGNLGNKDFVIAGAFDGQLIIEGSEDGIGFAGYHTLTGGGATQYERSMPEIVQYVRVRRTGAVSPAPSVTMGAQIEGPSIFSPPFADPPEDNVIYARPTGSDTEGDGSLANPYLTPQRVLQAMEQFGPPGVHTIGDISDLGVVTMPKDYVMPALKSAEGISGYNFADPNFYVRAAYQLRAYPQPDSSLTPAERTITAVNGVWNPVDPDTGLGSVTDLTQAWVPGSLKGKFLIGGGDNFGKSIIYDNTADTLFITDSGFYPFPLTIMEPSTILEVESDQAFGFGRAGMYAWEQDSISFAGLEIRPVAASGSVGIIATGGNPQFELCVLEDAVIRYPAWLTQFTSCYLKHPGPEGGLYSGRIACLTSLLDGPNRFDGQGSIEGFANVLDGCEPFGKPQPGALAFFGSLIQNGVGDGIDHRGTGIIADIKSQNNAGHGVNLSGPTNLDMFHITGGGNGGVGIKTDNGAQGFADFDAALGPTTVTGAGGDQKVGNLAAAAYPAMGTNIVDFVDTGARLQGV